MVNQQETNMPLSRFRVLDLTRVRAGPTCVRQLADWGADVIKIELPTSIGHESLGGPRDGPDFQNLHRNKRSLCINFKNPEGLEIFRKLAAGADVVVENFRPDVKRRLGIDYDSLKEINPRLVYGSISGFGQDGPYLKRPGVDQIAQGMGGLMSITGVQGQGPMRVGIPIADLTSGLLCAQGILVALLQREETGRGQWVHTSLLQAQIFMLDFQASRWLMSSEVAPQVGNEHPTGVPTNAYATQDGFINVAASGQHIYERFCRAVEADYLIDHPDYKTGKLRFENRAALNAEIADIMTRKSCQDWIDLLNDAGVPCGPIYSIDQVFADPQVKHLGMAREVENSPGQMLVAQPITMSANDPRLRTRAPEIGADAAEILGELGYDSEAVARLTAAGAI